MTRYTVHFTGQVQGVGFRYTTSNVAQRYEVAGYVQNLPDGRVRLVAEGEEGQLQPFLDDLRETMSRYIRDTAMDKGPATGEFGQPDAPDTFGVRY